MLNLAQYGYHVFTDFNTVKLRLLNLIVPLMALDIVDLVPFRGVSHQQVFYQIFAGLLNVARDKVIQLQNLFVQLVGVWVLKWEVPDCHRVSDNP